MSLEKDDTLSIMNAQKKTVLDCVKYGGMGLLELKKSTQNACWKPECVISAHIITNLQKYIVALVRKIRKEG